MRAFIAIFGSFSHAANNQLICSQLEVSESMDSCPCKFVCKSDEQMVILGTLQLAS